MAKRLETSFGTSKISVYDKDFSRCQSYSNAKKSLEQIEESVIFSMLPNDDSLIDVYLRGRLFEKIPEKSTLVDFSTTSYDLSRKLNKEASKYGHLFVDSPVSGGTEAARNGTLTLLLGCIEGEVKHLKPFLACMSSNQIYLSDRGNGCVAKVCNNFVLMGTMIITCEAITAAQKSGLDSQKILEVLNKCSGQSWVSSKYPPIATASVPNSPSQRNFDDGFQCKLAMKDLTLAKSLFQSYGLRSRALENCLQIYSELESKGRGGKDIGVYIEEL